MSQSITTDDLASARPSSRSATDPKSAPDTEEGFRLVRAFISIRSPERRQTVLRYVADLAKMDEAENTL